MTTAPKAWAEYWMDNQSIDALGDHAWAPLRDKITTAARHFDLWPDQLETRRTITPDDSQCRSLLRLDWEPRVHVPVSGHTIMVVGTGTNRDGRPMDLPPAHPYYLVLAKPPDIRTMYNADAYPDPTGPSFDQVEIQHQGRWQHHPSVGTESLSERDST